MSITNKHVIVSGEVQGVGYRAWTQREASALKLSGWVMNKDDGTVEAVFQGDKAKVEQMLQRLKLGPQYSRVESVTMVPNTSEEVYKGFEIRR